jgi:hypothetical protein
MFGEAMDANVRNVLELLERAPGVEHPRRRLRRR